MALQCIQQNITTDIIMILDSSASMDTMGKEPVQSVNAFLNEQKNNSLDDGATFTLVTFNHHTNVIMDNIPLKNAMPIEMCDYNPLGYTALNDAVCSTIKNVLESSKPRSKIVVIITDGEENSSLKYTKEDTKKMIKDCQDNHDWKFIFIGANIDAFAEGCNLNINKSQCGQFVQEIHGDLMKLCKQTSLSISQFRRARTDGYEEPELRVGQIISYPVDVIDNKIDMNDQLQSEHVSSVPLISCQSLLSNYPITTVKTDSTILGINE